MKRLERAWSYVRARPVRCSLLAALLGLLLFIAIPPSLLGDVSFSRAVYDRHGTLMRLTVSKDEKYRLFVPLSHISPALKESVLLHEDQHFYSHAGINPGSLVRAFAQTYIAGGRRIGASTLSMQLARMKFGIYSRNIPGKLWQIVRAMQLELHYSKDELFEAYLNLAPYGRNIEGVGAASLIYFNKPAAELTLPESVTLAVIPQSPARRTPEAASPAKPPLMEARNRLFAKLMEAQPELEKQKNLFALPLAVRDPRNLPFAAPHFVQSLLSSRKDGEITSTLDLPLQRQLEKLLTRYVEQNRSIGVNNASAMLVDTRNMEVVASIGSADFFNKAIHGQVDGTRSRRSPGSALKPFIFALAADQGLIHPLTLLKDAPLRYGIYSPDNFDRDFKGPISAADALRLSRNIPALALMAQLRKPTFYEFLKQAGIGRLKSEKQYGLSLVLGGAEVTMREMAALYAMLVNDGKLRPLRLSPSDPAEAGTGMLSAEASFMTLDILKDTPRPRPRYSNMQVYWKTGTSNSFRDAWTAGVVGPYVLVVWVGNFSGDGNPSFIGVRTAAPLFFDMAGALENRGVQEIVQAKAASLKLKRVSVCATTGSLNDKDCPVQATTWFIPGRSPLGGDTIYRRVLVDKKTGQRVCAGYPGETSYKLVEYWPSDVRATLNKAGIMTPAPLPAPKDCNNMVAARPASDGKAPLITSPSAHVDYAIRLGDASSPPIALTAAVDGDVQELFWFADRTPLGRTTPDAPLWWTPTPGSYVLKVVDDKGRGSSLSLKVTVVP